MARVGGYKTVEFTPVVSRPKSASVAPTLALAGHAAGGQWG